MMASVVGRAAFSHLRSDGHRYRSGDVRCRFVPSDGVPRRAFAIGRKFGSAVERNRARRRLDGAIDVVTAQRTAPTGDYLFACSTSLLSADFEELVQSIEHVFEQIELSRARHEHRTPTDRCAAC